MPAAAHNVALENYSTRLGTILRDRNSAQNVFEMEEKEAGADIAKLGFAALVPPYEKYAKAVRTASGELMKLDPPKLAIRVHGELVTAVTRQMKNLSDTAAAMKAEDGEKVVALSKARKKIEGESAASIKEALDKSGFDETAFADRGELVPLAKTAPSKPAG